MVKLNKSFVDNLQGTFKNKTFWDDEIKGFGLRIQGKTKSWIIKYRNKSGQQKMLSLSRVGKITAEEARKMAKTTLADIIINHNDPASEKTNYKTLMSISELCDLYLSEGVLNKKPSTIMNDKSRIERHIKPLIGSIIAKELRKEHIDKLIIDIISGKTAVKKPSGKLRGVINIKGGKAIAKRTLEMLGAILEFAKRRNIITENPTIGIPKPKIQSRKEFLNISDIKNLGLNLIDAQKLNYNEQAINAIKLLLLTGCRKLEILSLKWSYIDFQNQCFRFPDTKTGAQIRAFGLGAKHLLEYIQASNNSEWVFPSNTGKGYYTGIPKVFKKICNIYPLKEDLTEDTKQNKRITKDICLHTLRHSFASIGADMNYNELTIAGLLGHKLGSVTNRYSHTVDSSLVYAADKISLRIERALEGTETSQTKIINISRGA